MFQPSHQTTVEKRCTGRWRVVTLVVAARDRVLVWLVRGAVVPENRWRHIAPIVVSVLVVALDCLTVQRNNDYYIVQAVNRH